MKKPKNRKISLDFTQVSETLDNAFPSLKKKAPPLVLISLIALFSLGLMASAGTAKTASITVEVTGLIESVQDLSFNFTSNTVETIAETQFAEIKTVGRPLALNFKLSNATLLEPYFNGVNVRVHVIGENFDKFTNTRFNTDGNGNIESGTIQLVSASRFYTVKLQITYDSKDLTGETDIKLDIWGES